MSDLHLDCFSGLAGDMFLGACVDLGVPLEVISSAVEQLGLEDLTVEARPDRRGGIAGRRFRVLRRGEPLEGPDPGEEEGPGPSLSKEALSGKPAIPLATIRDRVGESALPAGVKELSLTLFARLGEAEAAAHGVSLDRVHLHEVGAVDSVVDVVGAAAAIAHLGPGRVTCGTVCVGSGHVSGAHGRLPVPAPATARLLQGVPVRGGEGGELLTPTGAALLAELVDEFRELPGGVVEGHGYGLGRREVEGAVNAFRLWRLRGGAERGEVVVLETQVDDLSGEGLGFLAERLLDGGALDVFLTPIQMKKGRPGTLVTAICRQELLEPLGGLLLAESGSLGCRHHAASRLEASRESVTVTTDYGEVRVKRASLGGRLLGGAPEYEDCRRLALASGVAWREVYRAALAACHPKG